MRDFTTCQRKAREAASLGGGLVRLCGSYWWFASHATGHPALDRRFGDDTVQALVRGGVLTVTPPDVAGRQGYSLAVVVESDRRGNSDSGVAS